jgi:hypothetical protein
MTGEAHVNFEAPPGVGTPARSFVLGYPRIPAGTGNYQIMPFSRPAAIA